MALALIGRSPSDSFEFGLVERFPTTSTSTRSSSDSTSNKASSTGLTSGDSKATCSSRRRRNSLIRSLVPASVAGKITSDGSKAGDQQWVHMTGRPGATYAQAPAIPSVLAEPPPVAPLGMRHASIDDAQITDVREHDCACARGAVRVNSKRIRCTFGAGVRCGLTAEPAPESGA